MAWDFVDQDALDLPGTWEFLKAREFASVSEVSHLEASFDEGKRKGPCRRDHKEPFLSDVVVEFEGVALWERTFSGWHRDAFVSTKRKEGRYFAFVVDTDDHQVEGGGHLVGKLD